MTPAQSIGVADGGGGVFLGNLNHDGQEIGTFFAAASGFGLASGESFLGVAQPAIARTIKIHVKNTGSFMSGSTSSSVTDAGGFENPELAFDEVKT